MTGDDSPQDSFYIPPTAGPGVKESKKPEKKPEDWTGLVIIIAGLIILLAGFQLFIIVMQLINTWISDQLVPFVTAAFDIIVIAAGIWILWKFSERK